MKQWKLMLCNQVKAKVKTYRNVQSSTNSHNTLSYMSLCLEVGGI